MYPLLVHFGVISIYSYGVLVAAGVLLALWFARKQAPRAGIQPEKIWNIGIYSVLVALVFSKVWLVFSEWTYYSANPREILSLSTFQSAGTFYGGVLGAVLTIFVYTYIYDLKILAVMDSFAAAVPLGHAIGRVGCFAAGCCYGKPTSLPWGVTFTNPAAGRLAGTPLDVRLHPTQLYEAAAEFLNFLLLIWLGKRQRFRGQLIGTYFILYGCERGVIEFFRGDPGRTLMFHDTVSLMQIVSVILIFTGAFFWWRGLRARASLSSATATPAAAAQ